MTQLELVDKMNLAPEQAQMMEKVLINGDLSILNPQDRVLYYKAVCDSVGLNPFTKPFDYIQLNGKLTLYAKRDCTDQLRKMHGISIVIASRDKIGDLFVVSAKATSKDGRTDESIGAVNITNLRGEALGNAMMKAETKAKRRVTLSIAGLGWLDETEVDTIPEAHVVMGDQANVSTQKTSQPTPEQSNAAAQRNANSPDPTKPYAVTGKVVGLIGADFKVNEAEAFFIQLEGGLQVLIPVDHPVIDLLNKMEGHAYHFLVFNWEGKHAIAGGLEAIKAVQDQPAQTNQSQVVEKPYLAKKLEPGQRPDGTPYVKILVVHQPTGNLVDAFALGTDQVNEAKKIQDGVPFAATFVDQNGFRFLTSVIC
ncbi:Restriction endonuclease [Brevibacillus sp. IT-7CA2]|uniref:hypothetical protein n=1 Tax=Brevibacillus sp. IT-7CA2 TaxID=3026436 RepID=UPI0039DF7A52